MKSHVMTGWVLLVCTAIDFNDYTIIIGTMLCPSESNYHMEIFTGAIKEKYPWLFSTEAKQKLLATADRGASMKSVLSKLDNVVYKSCAYHLIM